MTGTPRDGGLTTVADATIKWVARDGRLKCEDTTGRSGSMEVENIDEVMGLSQRTQRGWSKVDDRLVTFLIVRMKSAMGSTVPRQQQNVINLCTLYCSRHSSTSCASRS